MTQTHSDLGASTTWNRPRQQRPQLVSIASKRPDPVSGLMSGDAFISEAGAFLAQATRAAREVAVVSLVVEGLADSVQSGPDDEPREEIAAIGTSLLDVRAPRDVVGRVGAAEFSWIGPLGRSSELQGAVDRLRATLDANLDGCDCVYRLGHTLANGRRIELDELMVEARAHRDAPTVSAEPAPHRS